MKVTRRIAVVVGLAALLGTAAAAFGADPKVKPACPSLDGDWAGTFDGAFSGVWVATFTQSGATVSASAEITPDSGPRLEADGSGGIKCAAGKTEIAGSGSAQDGSGSFSGVTDETGKKLSGTWWSGDLFGTWQGERADHNEP